MRVAIYLRVSSEEQAEHGHGIGYQRNDCRQRAQELGAASIEEFADEGVSGAVLERPALDRLRAVLKAGGVDTVVCWDPDRLARKLAHQLLLTEEIEKHAKLVFVKFDWQDTPEGQLFYQLRGAVAQYEREKIRERTMAGRRQKARAGRLPFAMAPYGYRYDAEQAALEVEPAEAEVVRRVFHDFVGLKAGLNGIAHALTLEQVPTRKGGTWHRQVVRQMVMNPVYKGVYYAGRRDMSGVGLNKYRKTGKVWGQVRPEGDWIPVEVPALVEPEVWDKAQQMLEKGRRMWHSQHSAYLLSGLVNCMLCGCSMTGVRRSNWGRAKEPYYTCRKNLAGAKNAGCARYVRADELEDRVWATLEGWVRDPDSLLAELDQGQDNAEVVRELAAVDEALKKVQSSKRGIMLVLERNLVDTDDALDSLNRVLQREKMLLEQREGLEARRGRVGSKAALLTALRHQAEAGLDKLDDADLDTRRQLVRQYVVGVDVAEKTVTIRAKIPALPNRGSHIKGDSHAPAQPETHPR